jgi:hypothetical protein
VGRHGTLAVALAAALFVPAASSGTASGLRGKVSLYPARPVCAEDDPCTKPARGVLLVFRRDGHVAARVTTTAEAWYRVRMAPGRYSVTAPEYRRGSGVTPRVVWVPLGRIVRVDLEIDTGIQ